MKKCFEVSSLLIIIALSIGSCKHKYIGMASGYPFTINDGYCHFSIDVDSLDMMYIHYGTSNPAITYVFKSLTNNDTTTIYVYPRHKHGVIYSKEDGTISTMDKFILSDPERFCEIATNYPALEAAYVSSDTLSINETFESECCRHCCAYVGDIVTSYAICDSCITKIVIANCPSKKYAHDILRSYCIYEFQPVEPYRSR